MRVFNVILSSAFATIAATLLGSVAAAQTPPSVVSQSLTDDYVLKRAFAYDYVPEVIFFGGAYHMYWCGSVSGSTGDHVLHATSASLTGPFHSSTSSHANTYDVSLAPTGTSSFDGQHTCDPTVISINATTNSPVFYLFYDGAAINANGTNTAIGVASSSDGIHFSRLNGGLPIVAASHTNPNPPTPYGAGQPGVFYISGNFYLSFTDTTASGANAVNGAGQFLLKSTDPTFQNSPMELTSAGLWTADAVIAGAGGGTVKTSGSYAYLGTFSVDIAYDVISNVLLVGSDQVSTATWVYFVDPSFSTGPTFPYVAIAGTWRDGPSIAKNADHTMFAASTSAPCNRLLSIYKGDSTSTTYNATSTWDISLSQATISLGSLCKQ